MPNISAFKDLEDILQKEKHFFKTMALIESMLETNIHGFARYSDIFRPYITIIRRYCKQNSSVQALYQVLKHYLSERQYKKNLFKYNPKILKDYQDVIDE